MTDAFAILLCKEPGAAPNHVALPPGIPRRESPDWSNSRTHDYVRRLPVNPGPRYSRHPAPPPRPTLRGHHRVVGAGIIIPTPPPPREGAPRRGCGCRPAPRWRRRGRTRTAPRCPPPLPSGPWPIPVPPAGHERDQPPGVRRAAPPPLRSNAPTWPDPQGRPQTGGGVDGQTLPPPRRGDTRMRAPPLAPAPPPPLRRGASQGGAGREMFHKHIELTVVPVLIDLKRWLQRHKSPFMKNLEEYLHMPRPLPRSHTPPSPSRDTRITRREARAGPLARPLPAPQRLRSATPPPPPPWLRGCNARVTLILCFFT